MTPAEYAEAQLPATPIILGVRLQPFTLGHAVLLDRVTSPFAYGAEPTAASPGLGDLLLALEICRHEPFRLPSTRRMRWLGWLWRKAPGTFIRKACTALDAYIQEAFRAPAFWQVDKSGNDTRDSGVPLLLSLKLGLMSRLRLNEEAALKTPVRLAFWQLAAMSAIDGRIELINESDRARMEEAAAMQRGAV